jgi:hypothetical protein
MRVEKQMLSLTTNPFILAASFKNCTLCWRHSNRNWRIHSFVHWSLGAWGMLRIKHPEFQEGIQENAKVPCSGQASPGNCLLQRRENQNLFLEPLLKLKVNSFCTKLRNSNRQVKEEKGK